MKQNILILSKMKYNLKTEDHNQNCSAGLRLTRNKIYYSVSLLFSLLFLFSCKPEAKKVSKLDFKEYYSYANEGVIYPSEKQIEMLKAVMPKEAFQPAPVIGDRAYWNRIAAAPSGKAYLEKANTMLPEEPEVPISDEIYRRANKEGNRGIYKPRYYRTMERLEHFILAECLENKGRFLPQIQTYSQAILDMKSWLHPNHDGGNKVLDGKQVSIDLGARKFGAVLALAESVLGESMSEPLRTEIKKQLQWRITDTYLNSCKKIDKNNHWIYSTSNWNSVCTSGTILVSIINSENSEDRLVAIGSAINSMKLYISGFGDDGYCSEGLGYWGYGFGHYLYLAQIISDYTDGRINLFEGEYPEKLKNIGQFPVQSEIQKGTCAPFADGVSHTSSKGSNFANVLSSKYYGTKKPSEIRFEEAAEQIIAWENPELFSPNTIEINQKTELENYTYFDKFGMVISRGKQENPLSIAIKAGHNNENHNHMDVGSYYIVFNKDNIAGDIGAPSYRAGSFSDTNPARSSWGHPVPRIDNMLQSKGKEFVGKIINTEFTDTYDKVVINLLGAYEIPSLKTLIRTMKNDKSGVGTITIEDAFSSSKPVLFGTSIMTLVEYEIIDESTFILISENQKMKVEVSSNDGTLKIIDELVPVEHLREGAPAYRIGVDFTAPISKGIITVKYTPFN